jgi:hypothetical protein
MISSRKASADAVVDVHHTRDTVKSEAIKFEFLHIKPEIAEEKAENLVASIVEQSAIPELVVPFRSAMEVEMICSVVHIETVQDVLAGVRMDDIKQNDYAHAMGCIDELFQFFGGAVSRARGEEAGDLISKG